MKKNILLALMLIASLALVACGKKDGLAVNQVAEKKDVSNQKEIQEIKKEEKEEQEDIPQRTVAGTVAILDMLDYLDIEMIAIPDTKVKLDEKYNKLPNIGKPMKPDLELLKSVNPDIYISVTSLEADLKEKIEQNNIKTLFLDNSSYRTILESMEILGKMYDKEDISNKFVEDIEKKLKEIKEKVVHKEQPRVMVLFGSPKSIMFATNKCFVGSLIEELGAINVVDELGEFEDNYIPLSMENVLDLKPDVILRLTHASPEDSRKMFEDEFAKSDIWKKLDAVKAGKVYDLDNHYFGVSGNIRILEAFKGLEEMLYE